VRVRTLKAIPGRWGIGEINVREALGKHLIASGLAEPVSSGGRSGSKKKSAKKKGAKKSTGREE
jgi:uncharacterized protein YaiL (DUF2058 family)